MSNYLKTGYDPVERRWPGWIERAGMRLDRLPTVVAPGVPIGLISRYRAKEFGLPIDVAIVAGTTDGCAGFLANARVRDQAHGDKDSRLLIGWRRASTRSAANRPTLGL